MTEQAQGPPPTGPGRAGTAASLTHSKTIGSLAACLLALVGGGGLGSVVANSRTSEILETLARLETQAGDIKPRFEEAMSGFHELEKWSANHDGNHVALKEAIRHHGDRMDEFGRRLETLERTAKER